MSNTEENITIVDPFTFTSYSSTLNLDNTKIIITLKTEQEDIHLKLKEISYYITRYIKELEEQLQTKLKTTI